MMRLFALLAWLLVAWVALQLVLLPVLQSTG